MTTYSINKQEGLTIQSGDKGITMSYEEAKFLYAMLEMEFKE